MSWEAVSGKGSKRDPDVLDIAPNTTKLMHVLLPDTEEPVSYWTHYIPNQIATGPRGRVVICPGKDICPACEANIYRTKRVHAMNVWDYELKAVKILEGGNSVFQPLKQIKDQIGTLHTVDISIKKIGSGKDTQYSVIPLPMMQPFDNTQLHGLFPVASLRLPNTVEEVQRVIDGMSGMAIEATEKHTTPQEAPTTYPSEIHIQEPILQFGKYKGRTVVDIYTEDPNYIKWCAENISDPKIKAEAKRVVEQFKAATTSIPSGVISDKTAIELTLNEINEIFQEDARYKGNFALIIEKMKAASVSPLHPNGKTILAEYTFEELNKLLISIE